MLKFRYKIKTIFLFLPIENIRQKNEKKKQKQQKREFNSNFKLKKQQKTIKQ